MTDKQEKSEITPELEEKLSEQVIIQQAIEDAQKKAADYYDQLLRLKAEFDNFRKRSEREKADARLWGKQEVLMPLINLVDVFEQAMVQAEHAKDVKQISQGLGFLHQSFGQFLKNEGIEPIQAVGKAYDPHNAEAVEQEEVEEKRVGQVLSEIQRGYSLQGRILRPSRVRVGVAKKSAVTEDNKSGN